MEKTMEQIWRYIDGQMEAAEKASFEAQLHEDNSLKAIFNSQQQLHEQLKAMPLHKAPEDLASNVLSAIQVKPSYLKQYDSFAGLRFIIGGAAAMIVGVFIIFYFSGSGTGNADYPMMEKLIGFLTFDFSMSAALLKLLPYSLLLLSIVFLIWMDNFFQNNRLRHSYIF